MKQCNNTERNSKADTTQEAHCILGFFISLRNNSLQCHSKHSTTSKCCKSCFNCPWRIFHQSMSQCSRHNA